MAAALTITYAGSGQRDDYSTAIAGVLLKHTEWNVDDIDDFVYKIAVAAKDEEAEKEKEKAQHIRKQIKDLVCQNSQRLLGVYKNNCNYF